MKATWKDFVKISAVTPAVNRRAPSPARTTPVPAPAPAVTPKKRLGNPASTEWGRPQKPSYERYGVYHTCPHCKQKWSKAGPWPANEQRHFMQETIKDIQRHMRQLHS